MHLKEYIEEIEVVEIDKPNQKDCKLLPHETPQLQRQQGCKCCKQRHQRCNSKGPSYSE